MQIMPKTRTIDSHSRMMSKWDTRTRDRQQLKQLEKDEEELAGEREREGMEEENNNEQQIPSKAASAEVTIRGLPEPLRLRRGGREEHTGSEMGSVRGIGANVAKLRR
jgi:hypothetical protein